MRQRENLSKKWPKCIRCTGFCFKRQPAANGDTHLISIQVKRESHVNTGTTLPHLLPATVVITAELSSSSVARSPKTKHRRRISAMCSMRFHLCYLWGGKARLGIHQWNTQETGSKRGKAGMAAMFVMIHNLPFSPEATWQKWSDCGTILQQLYKYTILKKYSHAVKFSYFVLL